MRTDGKATGDAGAAWRVRADAAEAADAADAADEGTEIAPVALGRASTARSAAAAPSAVDPARIETAADLPPSPSHEPAARAAARAPGAGRRVRVEPRMPAAAEQVLAAKGAAVLPGLADAIDAPPRATTPTAAIVMIVGAVTCFSLLDTTAKWLVTAGTGEPSSNGLDPLFVVWMRYVVHTVILALAAGFGLFGLGAGARRAGTRVATLVRVRSWPLQGFRALCMFAATAFNFWALQYLDLSQTVAIFFVAPLVVTALAGPLLGEWVGWRRWAAIGVGFSGVVLMARPGSDILQPALVLSILSMLGYSLYVILTRKLAPTESPQSLVFVSAILPALLLTPALPWAWTPPETVGQVLLALTLGLYGVGGHFLLVSAYARATTGALAPFTYAQIPMMVLLGWVLFGNLPDGWTWLGIATIASAGLYVLARERALARRGA